MAAAAAQVARKADERDLFQFFSDCGKVPRRGRGGEGALTGRWRGLAAGSERWEYGGGGEGGAAVAGKLRSRIARFFRS